MMSASAPYNCLHQQLLTLDEAARPQVRLVTIDPFVALAICTVHVIEEVEVVVGAGNGLYDKRCTLLISYCTVMSEGTYSALTLLTDTAVM